MSDAYKERCRCIRDLKVIIPADIWRAAEAHNATKDNWRTVIIAVQILSTLYNGE